MLQVIIVDCFKVRFEAVELLLNVCFFIHHAKYLRKITRKTKYHRFTFEDDVPLCARQGHHSKNAAKSVCLHTAVFRKQLLSFCLIFQIF